MVYLLRLVSGKLVGDTPLLTPREKVARPPGFLLLLVDGYGERGEGFQGKEIEPHKKKLLILISHNSPPRPRTPHSAQTLTVSPTDDRPVANRPPHHLQSLPFIWIHIDLILFLLHLVSHRFGTREEAFVVGEGSENGANSVVYGSKLVYKGIYIGRNLWKYARLVKFKEFISVTLESSSVFTVFIFLASYLSFFNELLSLAGVHVETVVPGVCGQQVKVGRPFGESSSCGSGEVNLKN
ncbi:hypothetical protein OSB04_000972 [Centaurea solstitialis]|uniref:Uncharacterized protein n=1 Tax=Centaurea solstitialis TaxID=347529 RepID=A0AA38U2T6_9ASTR|nr:hypothetical protein OSB04_000972 [Centaurea solstitialis]